MPSDQPKSDWNAACNVVSDSEGERGASWEARHRAHRSREIWIGPQPATSLLMRSYEELKIREADRIILAVPGHAVGVQQCRIENM
jgi:hypothetical protein